MSEPGWVAVLAQSLIHETKTRKVALNARRALMSSRCQQPLCEQHAEALQGTDDAFGLAEAKHGQCQSRS